MGFEERSRSEAKQSPVWEGNLIDEHLAVKEETLAPYANTDVASGG
jgi:hypothetical protein